MLTWDRVFCLAVVPIITVLNCLSTSGYVSIPKGSLIETMVLVSPPVFWLMGVFASFTVTRRLYYRGAHVGWPEFKSAMMFSLEAGSTVGIIFILYNSFEALIHTGNVLATQNLVIWGSLWILHQLSLVFYAFLRLKV
jgi:hypothetical protein